MDYVMNQRISLPAFPVQKTWAQCLLVIALICGLFVTVSLNIGGLTSFSTLNTFLFSSQSSNISINSTLSPPSTAIPRLAYLISGSKGDLDQLWRTLHALYHPRNLYVLHLDLESPPAERQDLASRVANHSLFSTVGNVHVITKANMVTYRGPTMVANTLHACAILLKKSNNWDWFINLSASDYPLVTQDDLLYAFSKIPKNVNFLEHTSRLGWKAVQRAKPVIIDPGLYKAKKSEVFWMPRNRDLPDAFKLFTGSAWMALTREFVEFCIWGWDNMPRTLLMYYTNFLSSPEGYFHTVICNSPDFNFTVANHDLHYITWDIPPKQHPHLLTLNDTAKMISSNAPFARKFRKNDPLFDIIDLKLLRRTGDGVIPGGWCSWEKSCSHVSDDGRLHPGPGSLRLAHLMDRLLLPDQFKRNQCT